MNAQVRTVLALMAVVSIIVTGACVWPGHPVFWASTDTIRQYLLSRTPLGSSVEDVVADLDSMGVKKQMGGVSLRGVTTQTLQGRPRREIAVDLASYRIIFHTSVEAFYRFGEQGELVSIEVRKTHDTL